MAICRLRRKKTAIFIGIPVLFQIRRHMSHFEHRGDDDFSFAVPGVARFRANAYRQRGSMAAVIRVVAFDIPDYRDLHIPEEVMKLSEVTSGLVLVTGTAGSGKSTTQACIIDRINKTRETVLEFCDNPEQLKRRLG